MDDKTVLWIGAGVLFYLLYTGGAFSSLSSLSSVLTPAVTTVPYVAVGANGIVGTYQGAANVVSAYPLCNAQQGYGTGNTPCRLS